MQGQGGLVKKYDILICGIGGQGVISLGTILKLAAIRDGLSVAGAERRGGAQREGVVTSNIRYRGLDPGEGFNERTMAVSGLIPSAGADLMVAMEPVEALRHGMYLNENSIVIVNDYPLIPVAVRIGEREYPETGALYDRIREFTGFVHIHNIDELSREHFASLKQVNTISLGLAVALGNLPVSEEAVLETVREQFPDFDLNREAFFLGKELAQQGVSS